MKKIKRTKSKVTQKQKQKTNINININSNNKKSKRSRSNKIQPNPQPTIIQMYSTPPNFQGTLTPNDYGIGRIREQQSQTRLDSIEDNRIHEEIKNRNDETRMNNLIIAREKFLKNVEVGGNIIDSRMGDSIPFESNETPIKENNSYANIFDSNRSFTGENNDRNKLITRQGIYNRKQSTETFNTGNQKDLDKSKKLDEKKQIKEAEKEEKQIKAAERAVEKEEIRRLEQQNKPVRVLLTESQKKENKKQSQLRSKFKKQMNGI
jgi:hypothetical protein